jgi:hypothetical protein
MDDDELTEISELDVRKMAGVQNPASGIPFLLLKSAAVGETTGVTAADARTPEQKRGFATAQKVADRLGKRGVTMPLEAAETLAKLVDGACGVCGGSGQARHPQTGQFTMAPCPACDGTGGDEEAVIQGLVTKLGQGDTVNKKLKKGAVQDALGGNNLPEENGRVSGTLSADEVDTVLGGVAPQYVNKGIDGGTIARAVAITAAAEVERAVKSVELVNALTAGPGRDASYADEVGANAAAVARAQANAAGPSTPGRSGGSGLLPTSDPRSQLGNLGASAGSPEAGQPQLAYKAIRKLEKQLKKATDPLERASLGDQITRAKLSVAHTAGMI